MSWLNPTKHKVKSSNNSHTVLLNNLVIEFESMSLII
jgi:hypothetical protein